MVHVPTLNIMRRRFDENLQQYVKEHPGEFVLIEGDAFDPKVTFYKTEEELSKSTEKYKGKFGPTFFSSYVPVKTHRFNEGNKTLEYRMEEHVELCPNDGETKLVLSDFCKSSSKSDFRYEETAICPDCGYRVFRKPSEKRIKRFEENLKKRTY